MINKIGIFCASHLGRNPHYEEAARQLGKMIAQQGRVLYYGGSNLGYMGTVSLAALEQGGKVVGVIPTLFSDAIIYSQPDIEIVKVATMAERKERLIAECDGFIALPGGIGTVDEISEVLVANQLGICSKPMGILNVDGFYNAFLQQLDLMRSEEMLRQGTEHTLFIASTPEEMLAKIDAFNNNYEKDFLKRIRREE